MALGLSAAIVTGSVLQRIDPGGVPAEPGRVQKPARVAARGATPTTTTTVAPVATAQGSSVAPTATTGSERPARVESSVVAGSPWPVFAGRIVGASNQVARVVVATIGVSVHEGEAPLIGMSNTSSLGAPRVFLVVRDAGEWLQVLLPMRPNNSVGWIRRADVDVTTVDFRVEISRPARRIQIFQGDNVILDQAVAIGKASTPTPGGQFFTTELLQPPNGRGAYGPYAFTLSAYSTVFQRFGSGDGAVGMHGTNDPGSIGRDASHGCVRIANETISWMAGFLPLGTPVFIQ